MARNCLEPTITTLPEGSRYKTQAHLLEHFTGESYIPSPKEIKNALKVLFLASYSESDWVIHSSALKHFSSDIDQFTSLERPSQHINVATTDGHKHTVKGQGDVALPSNSCDINKLQNIFYVPSLKHNLMSIGQFVRSNKSAIIFGREHCSVLIITQNQCSKGAFIRPLYGSQNATQKQCLER